jgi:hypothetical protein
MSKSFLKGLALVGLGAVLLAAPAAAQIKWHIGIGANLPQGDLADENIADAGTGFGAHGGATFGLGEGPLGIKANASYETWKAGDTDESWNMLGVSADLVYNFNTSGGMKPYILAGGQWQQFGSSVDGSDTESGIGFNGGAGINFMLGSMGAFFEARYVMTPMEISGVDYDLNSIPLVFGLRF